MPSNRCSDEFETRALPAALEMDGDRVIRGYPIVFNKLSRDLGGFKERILPQAVDRSLKADLWALVDHDTAKVLGRTRSGTMALRKDRTGLRTDIHPDLEISYAKDIVRAVARGDVSGMSFAFRVLEQEWRKESGSIVRDVIDMEISEFSVVTFPAYLDTNVEIAKRSLQRYNDTQGYEWRTKWHEIVQASR